MNYHVATTHRVSVEVPFDVWDYVFRRRLEKDYERRMSEACEGNVGAGQNTYSEVEEWADFHHLYQAHDCGRRMLEVIQHFQQLLDNEENEDDA